MLLHKDHRPLEDGMALFPRRSWAIWIRLEPFKLELTPKSTSHPLIWGFSDCSLKLEENLFLRRSHWAVQGSDCLRDLRTFPVLSLDAGDVALNSEYVGCSLWALILTTSVVYLPWALVSQAFVNDIAYKLKNWLYCVRAFQLESMNFRVRKLRL